MLSGAWVTRWRPEEGWGEACARGRGAGTVLGRAQSRMDQSCTDRGPARLFWPPNGVCAACSAGSRSPLPPLPLGAQGSSPRALQLPQQPATLLSPPRPPGRGRLQPRRLPWPCLATKSRTHLRQTFTAPAGERLRTEAVRLAAAATGGWRCRLVPLANTPPAPCIACRCTRRALGPIARQQQEQQRRQRRQQPPPAAAARSRCGRCWVRWARTAA